jgi:hypothetical protein
MGGIRFMSDIDAHGRAYKNNQPINHDAAPSGETRHLAAKAFTPRKRRPKTRCASCATYAQIVARYEELMAVYREKYEDYEENTEIYKSNEKIYEANEKIYEANEKIYKSNAKIYKSNAEIYKSTAEIDRERIERFRDQLDGLLADLARERVIKSPHRGQSLIRRTPRKLSIPRA